MKKVFEISVEEMNDYEFSAKHISYKNTPKGELEVIACDSLTNLKYGVKERGWRLAWITCREGSFSYGQNIVSEYPYRPRYYSGF